MSKKKFSGPTTYYCIIRVEQDQGPIGWLNNSGAAYEYHLSDDKQEVLDRQSFSRAVPVSDDRAAEAVAEWKAEMDFYSRFSNIERIDLNGYSSVS